MTAIVVRPVRFTDNLDAMRRFLEVIGLQARVESERGSWLDMVAGAGMVALHSAADADSAARSGETRLSFEVDDVDIVAEQLRSVGVPDVEVIDEAYGRVLRCTDPIGDPVVADERSRDLYGYTLHRAKPDERLKVMPVRFTDPQGAYGAFLEQFGLSRRGTGDEYFTIHAGDTDCGQVGLHYVFDGELPIPPGPAAVHLTFETTEPLDDVRDRLREAGYADAEVSRDEFVALVSVTDPDGLEVQVHAATP